MSEIVGPAGSMSDGAFSCEYIRGGPEEIDEDEEELPGDCAAAVTGATAAGRQQRQTKTGQTRKEAGNSARDNFMKKTLHKV
jgi:hypothetical protein